MKPVGLLGGMVPHTTAYVMQKLVSATSAQAGTEHIPLIVHHKPQVPPRVILSKSEDEREPMPVLMAMGQDLERAGAQALALPNVEAHHYALAISHATTLPFLNMIEQSASSLKASAVQKIGLLAAAECRDFEVFDAAFEANALTPVWPKQEKDLNALIAAARQAERIEEFDQTVEHCARALLDQGAEHILIANTEISALGATLPDDIDHTDCLSCLCEAIAEFSEA